LHKKISSNTRISLESSIVENLIKKFIETDVNTIFEFISNKYNNEEYVKWDPIILETIKLFIEQKQSENAIKLHMFIKDPIAKIESDILCGRLKSAFQAASKLKNKELISKIKKIAEDRNDPTVVDWCISYLKQN